MKKTFNVSEMKCPNCVKHVKETVEKITGIQSVSVSLEDNSMEVEYSEGALSPSDIIIAVSEAGYPTSLRLN